MQAPGPSRSREVPKESPSQRRGFVALLAVGVAFALDLVIDVRDRDLFSWMDPYQYYDFARGVLTGAEAISNFEIPSILPFFVVPFLAIESSVRGALGTNAAAVFLLLYGLFRLCRELEIESPPAVVSALLLSSPLLLGLSRTLYSEFVLAAWMTLAFALWLRFLKRLDFASGLGFSLCFALTFMTKLTSPVFMILPVAGAVIGRIAQGDAPGAGRVLYIAALPIAFAVALHVNLFAPSLGYYLTVASTSLPFMHLMGPVEWASWSSATYYLREIGETFLWLLTPFLALSIWQLVGRLREQGLRLEALASPRAAVWLWLASPVLILILHPLKEPRHVAASVVPAVLLVVMAIDAVPRATARSAARFAGVALAVLQYLLITRGVVESPYYLDRALEYEAIREAMATTDERPLYRSTPEALRSLHWNYNQNNLLVGFPPNEALALTWQAFPGVAVDLEVFDEEGGSFASEAYPKFEDLFFLSGINAYNRRCDWLHYQPTLSREVLVAHADIVLANAMTREEALERFPAHAAVATVERRGGGEIQVLRATRPTRSYRALHARAHLERFPDLAREERQVVARELLIEAILAGESGRVRRLANEFREVVQADEPPRNIYWIGGYPALIDLATKRAEQIMTADSR